MKFLVLTICFLLVPGNSIKERWKNPVRGRCALPEPTYICRPAVLKYRFNREKRRCEWYTFGGCGDAIFDTMDQCNKTCGVYAEDPCLLPLDEGRTCKKRKGAPMPMFRFDVQKQQCVEFNYKGCGGNGNNFLEKRECWTACEKYVRSPCSFPIHGGDHCSGNTQNVLVFGYNSVTERCERFLHSGCGGYPNKFTTAKECWTTCTSPRTSEYPTRKCLLKGKKHSGRTFKKYFYNMTSDSCERSSYYLHIGNDKLKNRFDSQNECESICKANYSSSNQKP